MDIEVSGFTDDFYTRRNSLSSESVLSRLSTVLEHRHRLKELTISSNVKSTNFILEHLPRVNLKSARVLRVWGFPSRSNYEEDLFQKWKVPLLEELDWDIPERFPPSGLATQTLQVCSLRLNRLSDYKLMKIVAFLTAVTRLRSLKMYLGLWDGEYSVPAKNPEIRLPCLERLDVIVGSGMGLGPTAILLEVILCPGLKSLYLEASTQAEYSALTQNMRERYLVLTFFMLAIKSKFSEEDYFFVDIMGPLPSMIKSLSIKPKHGHENVNLHASQRNSTIPYDFCDQYPDLTHLDLEHCTIPGQNFYAKLSDILKNLRVSLNCFRPGRTSRRDEKDQLEERQQKKMKNAILTLQRAGGIG